MLLNLTSFDAKTPDELYTGIQSLDWQSHIDPHGTLAVTCICHHSAITHDLFAAQKIKDAIVDQLRERFGLRPDVQRREPDVQVYVYLHQDVATVSIDLAGESLHKRGYRLNAGVAPLKENLAAAILLRAGWQQIAVENGCLVDPMCGSGTLLIEAALIAGNIAPGLLRHYFGFKGWLKHQPPIWEKLKAEAETCRIEGAAHIPTIVGYDHDAEAIKNAFENIDRAGLRGKIHVEKRELNVLTLPKKCVGGLVVVNPPYGERLGEIEELKKLYRLLGTKLKENFSGFHAAVFTANPELGKNMGLRAEHIYQFFNGAIKTKLLLFEVTTAYFVDNSAEAENERRIATAKRHVTEEDKLHAQMFVNRLQKKLKQHRKSRNQEERYRIYDADIPEYAFIIELTAQAAYVQEYQAPRFIKPEKANQKRYAVLSLLPELLNLSPKQIFFEDIIVQKPIPK